MNPKTITALCELARVGHTYHGADVVLQVRGKVEATLSDLGDGFRITYPEGRDYVHTTVWGKKLTPAYIIAHKLKLAMNILNEDANKLIRAE